jgi:SAM-dependent methyltransferase
MITHKKIYNKNKLISKDKRILDLIYADYYELVKKCIIIDQNPTLEIGSGDGNIKKIIPTCITSDQFTNPNLDQKQNIYNINYKNNYLSNIILIDVFHHLEFPRLALNETHRVLKKNGRVIMLEPAMGILPRIIYKLFHHEPNGFNFNIDWDKTPKNRNIIKKYFAAQSLPWRAFVLKEMKVKNNFEVVSLRTFSDFAFLLSGGNSYSFSFYSSRFYPFVKNIDKFLTFLSKFFFSARMLIVLKKI